MSQSLIFESHTHKLRYLFCHRSCLISMYIKRHNSERNKIESAFRQSIEFPIAALCPILIIIEFFVYFVKKVFYRIFRMHQLQFNHF